MAARQSAAPAAPADKSYDPEIQDMAKYIHQYNVDSDLAVSFVYFFPQRTEIGLETDGILATGIDGYRPPCLLGHLGLRS